MPSESTAQEIYFTYQLLLESRNADSKIVNCRCHKIRIQKISWHELTDAEVPFEGERRAWKIREILMSRLTAVLDLTCRMHPLHGQALLFNLVSDRTLATI